LQHNKTTQLPNEFIFFDTETKGSKVSEDEEEHRLWFGCARYLRLRSDSEKGTKESLLFTSVGKWWDWVESHCRPHGKIWLFAHNTAYDFRILKGFTTLPARGWTMKRPIFDHGKFLVTWRKGTSTLHFSDTMNYFPTSLRELGRSVGEDKLTMPLDAAILEDWVAYCWQDVKVIERTIFALIDFLETEDLGSFGVTAARQAMNAYCHRFMSHKILIHTNEGASALELACYHGGRVEAFRLGELDWGTTYKLDVNSMYPYVMAMKQYPASLVEYVWGLSRREVKTYLPDFLLCGECYVNTDEPVYPYVIEGKLCFPVGRFTTYLTPGEIEYAVEHKHLVQLREGWLYDKAPLFADYVRYFYHQRKLWQEKGNKSFALFCKMLLNSLYGKFGQRVPESITVGEADPSAMSIVEVLDHETGETWREITIGGLVYREGERILSFNSFPAISATVTGYARIFLWDLISQAGRANVAYVDTDSLLVSAEGYRRLLPLVGDDTLGALKLEAVATRAVIKGLKDYEVGDERHTKGVRPTDKEIAPGVYETQQVPGIRNGLHAGDAERIVFKKLLKHFTRDYDKGELHPDGTITPYVLNEPR
jgi:hypothetical protein